MAAAAGAASFTRLMQKKSEARLCRAAIAPIKEHKTPMPAQNEAARHTRGSSSAAPPRAAPGCLLQYVPPRPRPGHRHYTGAAPEGEGENAALLSLETVPIQIMMLILAISIDFTTFFLRFMRPITNS